MKIQNPQFVISAVSEKDYPRHLTKEIALVGRSNVGKSSLINRLIHRTNLARTSSQPGRTQTINFYKMDDIFYMVDLPGYGFAKVPQKIKDQWGEMIEHYLNNREQLAGIIMLVDARHKPTEDDQMMYDWVYQMGIPTIVVATKVDKLKKSERKPQEEVIKRTLNFTEDQEFHFFSADSGEGKDEVWAFIRKYV